MSMNYMKSEDPLHLRRFGACKVLQITLLGWIKYSDVVMDPEALTISPIWVQDPYDGTGFPTSIPYVPD